MDETPSSQDQTQELLTRRVGLALRQMIQSIETARDRAAKDQNLHPTDFGCIGYLYRAEGPVSPKQVIAHMGLSSGSGTALLDRLEQAGYTRRLPNPDDRRSVLIELDLTQAAEPVQRYLEIEQLYRGLTEALSLEELGVIARFLEQMGTLTSKIG